MTPLEVLLCDVLPHVLVAPALFLASRDPARRRRAVSLWIILAPSVLLAAAALTDIFGAMRAASHIVFLELPLALALACFAAWRENSRRIAVTTATITSFVITIGIDSFFIEPRSLDIRRHTLASPNLDRSVRLAVVADLQFDAWGHHEKSAIDKVAAENPDAILFAGDYAQVARRDAPPLFDEVRAYLEQKLSPPLGIYAVAGNVDVPGWEDMFPPTAIVFSDARPATITRGPISVTGLPLVASFDPRLVIPRAPGLHIVLGHAPDFSQGTIDADLLVAGHTHGGQVQLPLIGPLITFSTVSSEKAAGGLFPHEGGHLVISRGVGMERGNAPRLRFRCPPELVFLELSAANGHTKP